MKRGFTLIELLVAVLIISVQKSVDKSRYATLMPLAKNIKDAQEAFYLGGGKYSKDLGSLDVRVPGNPSGATATLSDGTTVEISNTDGYGYVKMGKENLNNYYVMYQDRSSSYPGEIHCEALSDNDRANELCQNLGGTKIDNALTSGYTAYVLVGTGENAGSNENTGGTSGGDKKIVSVSTTCKYDDLSFYQENDISCLAHQVYDDGSILEIYEWPSGQRNVYEFTPEGDQVGEWYYSRIDGSLAGTSAPGKYSGSSYSVADYRTPGFSQINYSLSDGSFVQAIRADDDVTEIIDNRGVGERVIRKVADGSETYWYASNTENPYLYYYVYSTNGAVVTWNLDSEGNVTGTYGNVAEYADKLTAALSQYPTANVYDVSSFPAIPEDIDLRPFCERFPDYC